MNQLRNHKNLRSGILALALVALTLGPTAGVPALASDDPDTSDLDRLEPIRDLDGDGVVTFAERLAARPGLAGRLAAIRAYLIRIGAFLPVPLRTS